MEPYCLKDKILITKDFLHELESKSWQEIEVLQNQIANIADNEENATVLQLLKSLLTSYYVFIGGLENLTNNDLLSQSAVYKDLSITDNSQPLEPVAVADVPKELLDGTFEVSPSTQVIKTPQNVEEETIFEPFEYFVDFDEPSGEPISDEDLYG